MLFWIRNTSPNPSIQMQPNWKAFQCSSTSRLQCKLYNHPMPLFPIDIGIWSCELMSSLLVLFLLPPRHIFATAPVFHCRGQCHLKMSKLSEKLTSKRCLKSLIQHFHFILFFMYVLGHLLKPLNFILFYFFFWPKQ